MTQEQFRIEVQNSVKGYVQQLMQQYRIPAAMMEDALNAALLDIKPLVLAQLMASLQQEQEEPDDKEISQEEENSGERD